MRRFKLIFGFIRMLMIVVACAPLSAQVPVPAGFPAPVAYYSFDAASIRTDAMGNNPNAVINNSYVVTDPCGINGDALRFLGTSSYANQACYFPVSGGTNNLNALVTGTKEFSISFWFYPTVLGYLSTIDKRTTCTANNIWDLRTTFANNAGNWQSGASWGMAENSIRNNFIGPNLVSTDPNIKNIDGNCWIHCVLIRDTVAGRDSVHIFMNGERVRTGGYNGLVNVKNASVPMSFGNSACIGADPTIPFKGLLDELMVFNRALTYAEAIALYNFQLPSGHFSPDTVTVNAGSQVQVLGTSCVSAAQWVSAAPPPAALANVNTTTSISPIITPPLATGAYTYSVDYSLSYERNNDCYSQNVLIIVDSVCRPDTILMTDTLYITDTLLVTQTIHDTVLITVTDTLYLTDTLIVSTVDTFYFVDTITQTDTVTIYDTIMVYNDTLVLRDTITNTITLTDTLTFNYTDTIYVSNCDTVYIHDTIFAIDSFLIGKDAFTLYVPNAFSPNNDGINDFFSVYGEGFVIEDVKIFDRWGELVYNSAGANFAWDGTYRGVLCTPGVFVYYISYHTILNPNRKIAKGSITLLR